jgi:hypothetical protein
MTFGGRNLRGQNIALAWQNQSQQRIAVTVTTSCSTPLFYERWTRPTDFRLRSPHDRKKTGIPTHRHFESQI